MKSYDSNDPNVTKGTLQGDRLAPMQANETSANFLAANVKRLLKLMPAEQKAKIPVSTLRTVALGIKSPRLSTLDKFAALVDTPAWLLIHPQMKEWDGNRLWILQIVEAYLAAGPEGRELFHGAVRMVRTSAAPAINSAGH